MKFFAQYPNPARNACRALLLLISLTAPVAPGFGQVNGECVCGVVRDENGALIRGASVSHLSATVVTGDDGSFRLGINRPGSYVVEITAEGFRVERLTITFGAPSEIVLRQRGVAESVSIEANYLAGTPEALERTAGSIRTIGRVELEEARVFDFSEALRKVSGVNVRDEEGFGLRPNIGIRGTNPTRSAKVLLLEDGVPLAYAPYGDNASYYHPPVERFESIEVLKGSGQIEYGPVTVAGVVNYITPNPPALPALSLKMIGGNRDFLSGNASFGATWGRTGFVANLNRKQGEGARDNVRSGVSDFSVKVVRTLNATNLLTGKFSFFVEDSQVTYSGLTEAEYRAGPRWNPFVNDRFNGFRNGFSLQHTVVLGPVSSVTTNFYTNYFSRDWWRQSSNSLQRPNRLDADPDCRSMDDLLTTCGNEGRLRDYRNFGVEPRISTRFELSGTRSELQAGIRYHRETQSRVQRNGELPTSRDGVAAESNFRSNRAFSGFVQNRFVWGDLAVTAGIRTERISFERRNRLTGAGGTTQLTEVIPGLGFSFNLFRRVTAFAGVHRGFAPPRTEDIITNAGSVVDLESEHSWNYEAGVRARPWRGASLEAAFFRTEYGNQVVPASVAGGTGAAFANGGATLHQGFEIFSRVDFGEMLGRDNGFYVQVNVTELAGAEFRGPRRSAVSGFPNVTVTGNRIPYAPRRLINAVAGYRRRGLGAFVENNYVGRQFSDDLNTVDPVASGQRGVIPAQTYWNATVNYRPEKLRTTFFVTVKNAFDRLFIVDRSRGILPSAPRLIQAGVKIELR